MPADLAVVICQGFYHNVSIYQPLIEAFESRGIDAHCPQLPTSDLSKLNVGDINNPNFDLDPPPGGYPQGEEDTKVVLGVLRSVIERQNKRVLLLAHSAGGWVATQAAIPELLETTRQSQGLSGGLIGIFYFGAFVVPIGESIHTTFQPQDGPIVTPPWLQFHKHGRAGVATIFEPEKYLFNGVDAEQVEKWRPLLTASPLCMTRLTNNVYPTLPCAYLFLEEDKMLPMAVQRMMVDTQAEKTGPFKCYRLPSGHSPHLSHPKEMVENVSEFVAGLN